jgi:hypothetical protein
VGSTGFSWLAASGSGAVCVVKFSKKEGMDAQERSLKDEQMWWGKAYLGEFNVRVEKYAGRWALVMPHFDAPERTEQSIEMLKGTLQQLHKNGVNHGDVKWRNVGAFKDKAGMDRVIMFDFSHAVESTDDVSWIATAMSELMAKIGK